MEEVARLKREREIAFRFGMNVVCSTIVQPHTRRVLDRLAGAGLAEVWMGVESDPTLMHLTGKPITPAQVREAFRITREMGLVRRAYFILGFTPEETEETILNRIPFIEELDPDVVGFTIYIPVPGSPGYDHARHRDIDYDASCEYFNSFTRTRTLSNADLVYWQRYLVDHFTARIAYRQRSGAAEPALALKARPGRSGL
jgi:radical SAM superfamily enzyme YgiQ (UPF0313 family)